MRQIQAQETCTPYIRPVASEKEMLHWLAKACKEARVAAGRKQVHVAASADKDQSSIYRFEQGLGWPRETDLFVAAYADDLDIQPIQLWMYAVTLWQQSLNPSDELDLPEPPSELT